jgi:hypothetical protein
MIVTKGRADVAPALYPGRRQFMEIAIAGLAAEERARVHCLLIDDRAIAAAITLTNGESVSV